MKIYQEEITLRTNGEVDIIDMTSRVQEIVNKSQVKYGTVLVFCVGSTCAISTVEYEPGLKRDIPEALNRIFPKGIRYYHEDTWHDGNGHSHVRATFLKPDLNVPIKDGKLVLGTWQQIIFIELDVRKRDRKVMVTVQGL